MLSKQKYSKEIGNFLLLKNARKIPFSGTWVILKPLLRQFSFTDE